ncbi:N-acetylmuramoyl-L-alanine amidase [Litorivicinus lipolyticus]|nr:N-acetylmuramoyl-L-alanine amidase [Litorivicinus lipolyticus]
MAALLLTLAAGWARAEVRVTDVRSTTENGTTRLVLELSEAVQYRKFHLTGPNRLVVDLSATSTGLPATLFALSSAQVRGVRAARRGDGVRLVFDLAGDFPSKAFTLAGDGAAPNRLVLDIAGNPAVESKAAPVVAKAAAPAVQPQVSVPARDIVIMIDPGHGGKDPGALAKGGIREKDVVLAIARKLKAEFDRLPGFQGKLTRSGDSFIALGKRTQLARAADADFFVSLHADSFPKDRSVYGGGVYALSLRGATSETARWLAKRENAVDLSHGVDLGDVDDDLRKVLLNMSVDSAIRISKQAGAKVINEMSGVARMHRRRLEQANFVVLRSPDIPSLLVELGFLSNAQDVKRLTNPADQDKVAAAIRRGIVSYFESSPPANTVVDQKKRAKPDAYVVVRGDTLSAIAKKNGTTLAAIRRANGLSSNAIRIGQKLDIPRS